MRGGLLKIGEPLLNCAVALCTLRNDAPVSEALVGAGWVLGA